MINSILCYFLKIGIGLKSGGKNSRKRPRKQVKIGVPDNFIIG